MGVLLRFFIPMLAPTPSLGDTEIAGGCVAFALEPIYLALLRRRDYLTSLCLPDDLEAVVRGLMARRSQMLDQRLRKPPGQPYDREGHLAELREEKELVRLQSDLGRQKECIRVVAELPEIAGAIDRGTDLVVEARMFRSASEVERRCHTSIFRGEFEWVECRACKRRYANQECMKVEWSSIGAPRAGIGGERLTCPAGHVIHAMQTWVS